MSTLEAPTTPSESAHSINRDEPPATPMGLLTAAERIASVASARADSIDEARTLPLDLVGDLRRASLLRLMLPASLGGLEVDPATVVDVVETLSYGNGSTGWSAMIGNGSFFFAYLEPAVAVSLLGAGDVTVAGAFAPTGRAVADGAGGFTVDGHWTFNSGANHAEWLFEGVLVTDGGPPRLRPDGQPDWRFAYIARDPAAHEVGSIEIVDTWHALGLRGTGSNDVIMDGVLVPEEHTVLPFTTEAPHDGPLWRIDFMGLLGIDLVGVPLGIGKRALDEIEVAVNGRFRAGSSTPLAADPLVQHRLGRARAALRAARALVDDSVGSVWETACRGDRPSDEQHAGLQVALVGAMEAALDVTHTAFTLGGSASVRDGSVIQRCLRDLHTAGVHAAFTADPHGDLARWRLGTAA